MSDVSMHHESDAQQLVKYNVIVVNAFTRMHVTGRIRCVLDLADSRCVMNTQPEAMGFMKKQDIP
jgi:hypothetical protein